MSLLFHYLQKKNTLGRFLIMTEIYHISHKMFSHQKKSLMETIGLYSVLAIGAELQHLCMYGVIIHTGTHLDNSRMNQKEAPRKLLQKKTQWPNLSSHVWTHELTYNTKIVQSYTAVQECCIFICMSSTWIISCWGWWWECFHRVLVLKRISHVH